MTLDPERWERAKQLYGAASELPAAERERYLQEQCGADSTLRNEVGNLLLFHTSAESFLEGAPPLPAAPSHLGSYRIRSPLGYGGMSAVYLGVRDDGQFEKRVAIKILRAGIFGEEVARRFHTERQLLANFDHPNIVQMLDGGVAPDGRPYIIQDFVDGLPLNEWIRRERPALRLRLQLFADLCSAVSYVHERGVVHRDLKPSNVMVTGGGVVKLLDFGIAKLLDNSSPGSVATLTAHLMGTPAYASPEQVLGEKVGPTADIYALGLILYEMFANRQARAVTGWQDTMRLLEKEQFDYSAIPSAVARIVRRCLAKDPQARYQSAALLRDAITAIPEQDSALRPARRRRWPMFTAATLALAAAAAFILRPPVRNSQTPPYQEIAGELPSFSPDGKRMALITIPKGGGRRRITVRNIVTGAETHYRNAQAVKWSPDGRKLAYVFAVSETHAAVSYIDLEAGTDKEVIRRPTVNANFSSALAWTADSRAIITPLPDSTISSRALWAIDIANGQRTRLTAPPPRIYGDIDASVSPDGTRLAFVRAEAPNVADAFWKELSSGPNGPLYPLTADHLRMEGVEWLPGGREVAFASRRTHAKSAIWKAAAGQQVMEPVLLQSEEGDCAYPAASRSPNGGLYLAYWHRRREANIYLRSAPHYSQDQPVAIGPLERYNAAITSDGTRVVFNSNERGTFELYTTDNLGTAPTELTAMRGPYTGAGQWSPDKQKIAFESSFGPNRDIFVISAQGGVPTRFTTEPSNEGRPFWSRDGKWIYFRSDRSGSGQIWRKRSDGSGEAVQITRGGGFDPAESLDGKTLYYLKSQTEPTIWSVPVSGGQERMLIPAVQLDQWTVTSAGILYLDRLIHAKHTPVKLYNPADGTSRDLTSLPCSNYCMLFTATPDAKHLLWGAIEKDQSDMRLLEIPST
ncbi:MAG: protein kinase [Bryobacteraceae bacterium]